LAAPELVTDQFEKRDDRLRLQKALEELPTMHRRILTSHFIDGLSIRDIARHERVPVGTVLSRIHKGKQLLRDAWEARLTAHPEIKGLETSAPTSAVRQAFQRHDHMDEQRFRFPESPVLDR
jgi:predicted RNA polymerase sigma factor